MSKFLPKQLFGPSSLGTAQARALEQRGGDFQWAQRDANTVVKKQGDFRKVLISGGGYLTRGQVAADPHALFESFSFVGMSGVMPYQLPFQPGSWAPAIPIGQDQYMAANRVSGSTSSPQAHNYNVHPPVDDDDGVEQLNSFLHRFNSFVWRGTPRGLSNYAGLVNFAHTRHSFVDGGGNGSDGDAPLIGWNIPSYAQLVYIKRLAGPPADKMTMVPFLADLGRTDGQGRLLPDLVVSTWTHGGEAESYPYSAASFTRTDAEFSGSFGGLFAMREYSGFFFGEYFFAPGLSGSPAQNPRLWMLVAEGHDYSAPSVYDVTDSLFLDRKMPSPRTYADESWTWFSVEDGGPYSSRMALSMRLMKVAVLPNNILLVATVVAVESLLSPDVAQWACRMVRFDLGDMGSPTTVLNELAPTSERDPGRVIDDLVHLGEGWVLAKQTDHGGLPGGSSGGMTVRFLRSEDAGLTWSEFTPTGFDGSYENQSFGRITVHRSRAADQHGVLLMPSWYPAGETYHVYESRDSGLTWARKGRIAKTARFDSLAVYNGEELAGSSNFALLTPSGDLTRPVDVTMPNRYDPP